MPIRTDSSSHLLRSPFAFEGFLFFYLVCALWMQNVNIFKKNLHLIDYNLLLFIILLLSRRLAWAFFQELHSRWKFSHYWFVAVSVSALLGWALVSLLQDASIFNLLFLFYPLLLYLSLFGFTLEPRQYRQRFAPPHHFLQHLDLLGRLQSLQVHKQRLAETGAVGSSEHISTLMKGTPSSSFDLCSILLPATPDEIRAEVDILLSDLIVRLKQLLFNSLLCAYYAGFIPMQFTENYVYYDRWWSIEVTFFIWANSFVILSSHLLPPNYCQILYQCALHLGCWARCSGTIDGARPWTAEHKWPYDAVVVYEGEYFKGEGSQNVALPCDSSQECFYLLFNSHLHIHSWLLAMQCIIVTFEIVVLMRVTYWYQILSISIFLVFNYFILHKLLYNRLMFSKLMKMSTQ